MHTIDTTYIVRQLPRELTWPEVCALVALFSDYRRKFLDEGEYIPVVDGSMMAPVAVSSANGGGKSFTLRPSVDVEDVKFIEEGGPNPGYHLLAEGDVKHIEMESGSGSILQLDLQPSGGWSLELHTPVKNGSPYEGLYQQAYQALLEQEWAEFINAHFFLRGHNPRGNGLSRPIHAAARRRA